MHLDNCKHHLASNVAYLQPLNNFSHVEKVCELCSYGTTNKLANRLNANPASFTVGEEPDRERYLLAAFMLFGGLFLSSARSTIQWIHSSLFVVIMKQFFYYIYCSHSFSTCCCCCCCFIVNMNTYQILSRSQQQYHYQPQQASKQFIKAQFITF